MKLGVEHYSSLCNSKIDLSTIDSIYVHDHLGGFDSKLNNQILEALNEQNLTKGIYTQYHVTDQLKNKYPNLKRSVDMQYRCLQRHFENYNIHPELDYQNFVCSFNRSGHVSRQLLVSALNKFGYFNKDYCSKYLVNSGADLEGHIRDYVKNTVFYNKFFDCTDKFTQQIYSCGVPIKRPHSSLIPQNIYNIENQLTQSFLHIVSETMAESYYPYITEKFLYSLVTRGLFLAYGQPYWHAHLEKYHGYKLYTKLFNYKFDSITNPVKRLVELMTMIGKFSKLTPHEWHDLYLLEQDTIEYNYDHYFSKNYLKSLKQFDNTSTI